MKFHKDGTLPADGNAIFVFGSNKAGRHGAGAALIATRYGAKRDCYFGPRGNTYAIPTKDERLRTLTLHEIQGYVSCFLDYALMQKGVGAQFFVTRIGCGLAGYKDSDIAPMFRGAPDNCSFAEQWRLFTSKP